MHSWDGPDGRESWLRKRVSVTKPDGPGSPTWPRSSSGEPLAAVASATVLADIPAGGETELVTATSLGDVIDRARRRSFVGRRSELQTFDDARAGRSPRRVLFVHGPGGMGKTTLLLEMRARASAAGWPTILLDGSEIDPSPDGFSQAAEAAGPVHAAQDARTGDRRSGTVLLVDGYEQLGAIDGWLRQEFVPPLQAEDVMVLAGREPPAAAWRTDPGWREVVAVHPLGPRRGRPRGSDAGSGRRSRVVSCADFFWATAPTSALLRVSG